MSQQDRYSPPVSPNLTSVSSPSLCVEDLKEVHSVGQNGEEDEFMLPFSDSD